MKSFHIDGKVVISGQKHDVEYEPGGMTGLSTLYLRVKEGRNVPIYIGEVDEVIKMLKRVKKVIESLEGIGNGE